MRKQKFKKHRLLLAKAEQQTLLVLFFSVPLFPKITTLLIILYVALSLVNYKREDINTLWSRKSALLFLFIFFMLLIGLIYTPNMKLGSAKVQTQLSFLVFPLFLGRRHLSGEERIKNVSAFVFGVFVTVLLCLTNGFYRLFQSGKVYILDEFSRKNNIFFYKEFSEFLDLHPTYFSIYLSIALFALLTIFGKKKRVLRVVLGIIFTGALVLTSSKAGIFSFIIIIGSYGLYKFFRTPNKTTTLLLSIVIAVSASIFVINPILFKRSQQLFNTFEKTWESQEQRNESSSIRFGLWKLSYRSAEDAMIFGHGTGSVNTTLNDKCLEVFDFSDCEDMRNKNSHNQYLNFLVSNGFLILLPFLALITLGFFNAFKKNDIMFLFFLSFMTLNFFFESLLQRERGVVFFSLFFMLFIASQNTSKSK